MAVLMAVDQEALYDLVMSRAPEFVRAVAEADTDAGRPLLDVFADIEAEEAAAGPRKIAGV